MRVALLIKHEGQRHWHVPDVAAYPDEARLKTMLRDAPELFPFEDERRPVVMVDEFPVSFGSADLIGVSVSGSITVVECKLHTNPDMRRTIVGQLFAYAAALWEMSYEDFDDRWQAKVRPPLMDDTTWEKRKRPSLVDCLASEAIAHEFPFDTPSFTESVRENLRAGRFTLVLAVDEITPELQRVIEYLSAHTASEVDVIALELGYVADGDVEILVPQQFGLEMAERKVAAARRAHQWDADSFVESLRANKGEWALPMVADLLDWARTKSLLIWYGAGAKFGTVYAGLNDDSGARHPLFGCWTSGSVEIEFHQLKSLPPFDSHEARVELLHGLGAIDGVTRLAKWADTWPSVDLTNLRKPGSFPAFIALWDDVVRRIREA